MVKRAAAAAATAASGKRAKVEEEVTEKCSAVSKALASSRCTLPKNAKDMLRNVIPYSLAIPEPQRGTQQAGVVGMIGQTLEGMEAKMEADLGALDEPLQTTEAKKGEGSEKLQATEATLAERQAAVEGKKEALATVTLALRAGKARLAEAKQAEVDGDQDLLAAEKEHAQIAELRDTRYEPLKASTCEGEAETNQCKAGLAKLGKLCGVVDSLMTALPSVLEKAPASRGGFDETVLEQFQKAVGARLATLQETMTVGGPARAERQAVVAAAEKAVEDAKEAQRQAAYAQKDSQAVEEGAAEAVKEAQQALQGLVEELSDLTERLEQGKAKLEAFRADILAPFKELRERPLPEEPEKAPEEAPAEEAMEVAEAEVGGA